jgi:Protein of unknown function (DUF3349)
MGNKVATPQVRKPWAHAGSHGRPDRIRSRFQSLINWLRAGYADEAPRQGHSPLIALNGPTSLSDKQTREIADGLAPRADRIDVEVAITKTTDRLPTDAQVRTVRRALQSRRAAR